VCARSAQIGSTGGVPQGQVAVHGPSRFVTLSAFQRNFSIAVPSVELNDLSNALRAVCEKFEMVKRQVRTE